MQMETLTTIDFKQCRFLQNMQAPPFENGQAVINHQLMLLFQTNNMTYLKLLTNPQYNNTIRFFLARTKFRFFIILFMQQLECTLIECLQIPYEFRTHSQHRFIAKKLISIDPFFNTSNVSLLSFFALPATQLIMQEELAANSLILSKTITQSNFRLAKVLKKDLLVNICKDDQVILIKAGDIQKCEALNWNNPENEVKSIHQWPIFCEIQRKKLYDVLRHCKIVLLSVSQIFYREGDSIQNGYFLIRQGEFSFMKRDHNARTNVQLLKVRKGFLFCQDANQHQEDQGDYDQILDKDIVLPKFNYTVKCKSSQGLIYCIDFKFFGKLVANVCQDKVKEHIGHKLSYLQERAKTVQVRRSLTANLLGQHPQRAQSVQLIPFTAPTRSFSRQITKKPQQMVFVDLIEKPSDYKAVRQSLPRRDKLFSKKQLKKLYPDPQQDESDALIWKKAKCERLKQLTRLTSTIPSRSQILFQFTKTSILFQKHKRRLSIL